MKKRAFFLLGLLCLYYSASAQTQAKVQQSPSSRPSGQGQISGILVDSLSEAPLGFATVALLEQDTDQFVTGTLTDENGKFSFSELAAGVYALQFSFIGYETKTLNAIKLTEGTTAVELGRISLKESLMELEEVTVQGLRPSIRQEADRMVVSIEGTALAAGSTAFDVLAKSPGVYIDQDGNIQLHGRSGVRVMIDGRLTYLSARELRILLEGMSAENIKDIEIITNPSAKYDAEGSSGILNINLKKNELQGVNGSVYAGYVFNGKQHAYSTGGNVNYKTQKWNSFLTLDMARRAGGREATFTRVFRGEGSAVYFDQEATGNFEVTGPPAVRLGTDYSLNTRHSVGVMANFGTNTLEYDFLTDTYIGSAPNSPDLYIDANNYISNRFTNYTTNLHYAGKFDTLGTSLSADLDYVLIRNQGEANFYNYFDSLATDPIDARDFLYTNSPNGFDIYSAKLDFTYVFRPEYKLELGAKASRVISNNDSRFYFNNGELPILDPQRTNHFIYDERIYAAYLNGSSRLGENLTLQAGLRAEQTQSRGELKTSGQLTERSYLDLFPSVFVQQKISEHYAINYNYSRRIQRPNYGQLNPFLLYRDPYTWTKGNPYLQAQYTHAFGITQVFKQDYSLALNYQLNRDVIAELPAINEEDATTVYYTGNVDDGHNLSLTAVLPFRLVKNWETNNTVMVSYNEYNMLVNDEQVRNDQLFYMLQSNHNILLPLALRLEINAAYLGPTVYALYVVEPRWWMHLGLKKSFLEEKLELSLNVNDVFRSQRLIVAAKVGEGNINDFNQYFRNRNVGLTLRFNFSKGAKFETRSQTPELDELNRTGN